MLRKMRFPIRDTSGQVIDEIDLLDEVFAVPFNESVVHQAIVRQRNNARLGVASTKTRSMVRGSARKLFIQKKTGRARRGNAKSPLLRSGGVAFGPHPRSYRQRMPKKMRRLALKCVLSARVQEGAMMVVDRFPLEQPKTQQMKQILNLLGVNTSALIVTPTPEANLIKSARNLPGVKTLPVALINPLEVLSYRWLVMTLPAVRQAEQLWGGSGSRGTSPAQGEGQGEGGGEFEE